jgi:hypothetical protein
MPRYHINPRTGNPGICRAEKSCPFGDMESDHYSSKEAAREAYELEMGSGGQNNSPETEDKRTRIDVPKEVTQGHDYETDARVLEVENALSTSLKNNFSSAPTTDEELHQTAMVAVQAMDEYGVSGQRIIKLLEQERERANAAEIERDENEGAFKVWRTRTYTAEARVKELEEQLEEQEGTDYVV